MKVVREKGSSDATAAPSKVEWTLARDALGRVETSTDPDRGAWVQKWNGFGELTRRTAPSGRYATFAHDGLGRVTARREHGPGGGLELGASWTWDGANGLGRVSQASESVTGYQRTHSYDSLGRIRTSPPPTAARPTGSAPPTTSMGGCSRRSTRRGSRRPSRTAVCGASTTAGGTC